MASAFEGAKQFRFLVMTLPALLNRRSLATDVAGTASSRRVTLATVGYRQRLARHQSRGDSVRLKTGVDAYDSSSCRSTSSCRGGSAAPALAFAESNLAQTEEITCSTVGAAAAFGEMLDDGAEDVSRTADISASVASMALQCRVCESNGSILNRGLTSVAAHNSSSANRSPNLSRRKPVMTLRSMSRPPCVARSRCCRLSTIGMIIDIIGYDAADISSVTSINGRNVAVRSLAVAHCCALRFLTTVVVVRTSDTALRCSSRRSSIKTCKITKTFRPT